jgi:hypothetical protein
MSGSPEIVAAVDGDLLMRHCEEFAKRIKLSGTPEERESFLYLKGRLESYGYRTELLEHDAYISLPGLCYVEVQRERLASITHSFSLRSPAGGLTAPIVDVGDGGPEDFAKHDCRGRIVLVNGIASPAAAARTKAAGAAGQLRQPARASARNEHFAGLGQSFRRDHRRDARDGRLHDLAG